MMPEQALRETGDFTRVAQCLRASAEAFVRRADIRPGMQVLDLACGDGTTAIPAGRLGARVTAVEVDAGLVAAGQRHAAAAGHSGACVFLQGEACDLRGIEDGSFDRVISFFGASFAPRPLALAREMVRVTRPGGRILMAHWMAHDAGLVAQLHRICSAWSPPAEGAADPMAWGSTPTILERFGAGGIAYEAFTWAHQPCVFEFDGTPAAFAELFLRCDGATLQAMASAQHQGRSGQLREEVVALFEAQNRSADPGRSRMHADYLWVSVDVG